MGNPKQKWTSEEEEALRAGVRKHGTGKWKDIQKDPEFNPFLSSRSNIDLKDKWRNMSVSGGMGGPREKAKTTRPRDSPVTLFANPTPQTSAAASVKREPSAALLKREPSSAPVKREAASSLVKGEPVADDSPTEAKTEAKTAPLYNALIFEALETSTDPNGLETGAIANFIEQRLVLEKKNEVPQNFRRLLSSRLRRLVAQEKLEKFQNCFKMKGDSSANTKVPPPPTPPVPNAPKQNETPPAPKQNDVQLTQLQSSADVIPYETVEEAAVAAAYKIAEAENKSFVAAEAVKESERVSQMFEDTNSVLQLAEEFLKKCLQGEVLLLV